MFNYLPLMQIFKARGRKEELRFLTFEDIYKSVLNVEEAFLDPKYSIE